MKSRTDFKSSVRLLQLTSIIELMFGKMALARSDNDGTLFSIWTSSEFRKHIWKVTYSLKFLSAILAYIIVNVIQLLTFHLISFVKLEVSILSLLRMIISVLRFCIHKTSNLFISGRNTCFCTRHFITTVTNALHCLCLSCSRSYVFTFKASFIAVKENNFTFFPVTKRFIRNMCTSKICFLNSKE